MVVTWFIIIWFYLAGMSATYAVDENSFSLIWFNCLILIFWPLWVTTITLWFLWRVLRERKWTLT